MCNTRFEWLWCINCLSLPVPAFTVITVETVVVLYSTEVAHAEDCVAHLLQRIAHLEQHVHKMEEQSAQNAQLPQIPEWMVDVLERVDRIEQRLAATENSCRVLVEQSNAAHCDHKCTYRLSYTGSIISLSPVTCLDTIGGRA